MPRLHRGKARDDQHRRVSRSLPRRHGGDGARASAVAVGSVEQWSSFVEPCEDGYAEDIYEYENDLSVRDILERILRSDQLQKFEQMAWARAQVNDADQRFRELLSEQEIRSHGAWQRRMPRVIGAELAADVRERYGVDITVQGTTAHRIRDTETRTLDAGLSAPGTLVISGKYHGDVVTHYLDPATGLDVIAQNGTFVSVWKLNRDQLSNILNHGGLGGG